LLSCLANADILALTKSWQNFVLLPVVDGDLFPVAPEVALTNPSLGFVKPAPNFMLAVPTPGTLFVSKYIPAVEFYGWEVFLQSVYGPQVGALIAEQYSDAVYGPPSNVTYFIRGANLIGDSTWLCPLRRHATFLKSFTPDVYVAMWNVRPSFINVPPIYAILHGAIIPFLFGNAIDVTTQLQGKFTPEEAVLSKQLIHTVGEFMRTGKPGSEYPVWTPELHAEININTIPKINPLSEIRVPRAGILPPFPNSTRCDLYDLFFEQTLSGALDGGKIAQDVGLKGNYWGINSN